MSDLMFKRCDACGRVVKEDDPNQHLFTLAKVGFHATSGDVCSLECAQVWIATAWNALYVRNPHLYLLLHTRSDYES